MIRSLSRRMRLEREVKFLKREHECQPGHLLTGDSRGGSSPTQWELEVVETDPGIRGDPPLVDPKPAKLRAAVWWCKCPFLSTRGID